MSTRKVDSANTVTRMTPSTSEHYIETIANQLAAIKHHEANRVHEGGLVEAPSTPSAQLTGTGNTTWSVNMQALLVCVGGVIKYLAAAADYAIHSGSYYTAFANGTSAISALVMKNVSGTVTLVVVKGAAAITGTQVAPTDAEIQAAVGAANSWVKVGESTLNRTADTTVTQAYDSAKRPILGVTADLGFASF